MNAQVSTRTCSRCTLPKPHSEFGKDQGRCRPCKAAVQREWRKANPTYAGDYTARTKAEQAARDKKRRVAKTFGLTVEEYEALLAANPVCQVCGRGPRPNRWLTVDHCHATGAVRGVLCPECNSAMGMAQDDPERLRALAAYLEAARA